MNKDSYLVTSTVRPNSWGTRDLSWLDQYILVPEANFVATELEHLRQWWGQDESEGNQSRSDKSGLLKNDL